MFAETQSQIQRPILCPKGHNLIQTYDLLNLYEKRRPTGDLYCCNLCGKDRCAKITGTNHCIICNFNFCFDCDKSRNSIQINSLPIQTNCLSIQVNCPQNHPLLKASSLGTCSNYLHNRYRCDFCQAIFDSSIAPAAYCRTCYYDLCPSCHINAQQQISINSQSSVTQKTLLGNQVKKPEKVENNKKESENKENGDNMLCVVCLTEQRSSLFVPCIFVLVRNVVSR